MKDLYIEELTTSTFRFNALTIQLDVLKLKDSKIINADDIKNSSSVLIFKGSSNDMKLTGLPQGTEGQIVMIVNLSDHKLTLEGSSESLKEYSTTKFCIPSGKNFDINSKHSAMFMYFDSLFKYEVETQTEDKKTKENMETGGWLLLDFQGESNNQAQ